MMSLKSLTLELYRKGKEDLIFSGLVSVEDGDPVNEILRALEGWGINTNALSFNDDGTRAGFIIPAPCSFEFMTTNGKPLTIRMGSGWLVTFRTIGDHKIQLCGIDTPIAKFYHKELNLDLNPDSL